MTALKWCNADKEDIGSEDDCVNEDYDNNDDNYEGYDDNDDYHEDNDENYDYYEDYDDNVDDIWKNAISDGVSIVVL